MKKFLKFNKSYIAVILVYFAAITLLKSTETIILLTSNFPLSANIVLRSFAYTLIVSCFYVLLLYPLYALINIISKKAALITLSVLFSFLLIAEIGLTAYTASTGLLMGSEIILRPVSEIWQTIGGAMNIYLVIFLVIVAILGFLFLVILLNRRKFSTAFSLSVLLIIVIGSLFMFWVNTLIPQNLQLGDNKRIINKSWYCIFSSIQSLTKSPDYTTMTGIPTETTEVPVDKDMLASFVASYPNRNIENIEYPLERLSGDIPDVLSPYFKDSDVLPNIVVIIVESLGRSWSGDIGEQASFTPFIDSLAQSGLYWKNCFSTTHRSFGSTPAVTGSVPFGIKGFQFGIMPEHHSLFSILKSNNYQTNAFYGGDIAFDCVYEYLVAQNIDFMSNFYKDIKKYWAKGVAGWWGLHDHAFFEASMEILNESTNDKKPVFNHFITMTSHEFLDLKDKELQEYCVNKTQKVISGMSKEGQAKFQSKLTRIASIVYADHCLKQFMEAYKKRDDFNNTIFIITGDHSTGHSAKNAVSLLHVPLLIWSPLIDKPEQFPALITHSTITPSIISLLQNKYGLNVPNTVHWISDGLDTSSVFRAREKILILDYSRKMREFIYEDYYYIAKDAWESEGVFKIDENIDIKHVTDENIKKEIGRQLQIFKYVNNYVYHNDRLFQHDNSINQYILIDEYKNPQSILCTTPDVEPSKKTIAKFPLFPTAKIPNANWEKLKVTVYADVYINDVLSIDRYMSLEFDCSGDNMEHPFNFKDNIVRFLPTETVFADSTYRLIISKEFLVKGARKLNVSVNISSTEHKKHWAPNSKLTVSNVNIKIEGIKSQDAE